MRRTFTEVGSVRGGHGARPQTVHTGALWILRVVARLGVLDVVAFQRSDYHQTRHAYVRRRIEAAYLRAKRAHALPVGSSSFHPCAGDFLETVERDVLTHAHNEERRLYPVWLSGHQDRRALVDALVQEHESLRREVRILRAMITCGDETGAVAMMRRIVQDFIAHTRHEEGVLMRFSSLAEEKI